MVLDTALRARCANSDVDGWCYVSGAFPCAALPVPGRTVSAVPHTCTALSHDDTGKAASSLDLRCSMVSRLPFSGGAILLPRSPAAAVMHACTVLLLWHWRQRAACLGYGGTLQLPCGIMCGGSRVGSSRSHGLQKGLVQGAALQEHLLRHRRIGRLPVSLEGPTPQVRVAGAVCAAAQLVGSWCSGTVCIAMQLVCSRWSCA